MDGEQEVSQPEGPYDDCFPFRPDERWVKYELIGFVDKVISLSPLDPRELKNLAILKYALGLLPLMPTGVHIGLGMVLRVGGETSYCDLFLSEASFKVSKGGYVSGSFGGDSFSTTIFECEAGGFRDGSLDHWGIGSWELEAIELLSLGAELAFENETEESDIEWDREYYEDDPWDDFDEKVRKWVEAGGEID